MTQRQLSTLIKKNRRNSAIILGNGINRFANTGCSWTTLLKELAKKYCPEWDIASIPDGISYTEFFDALEISTLEQTPYLKASTYTACIKTLSRSSELIKQMQRLKEDSILHSQHNENPFKIENLKASLQSLQKIPEELLTNLHKTCSETMTISLLGDKFHSIVNSSLVHDICNLMTTWQFSDIHCKVTNFAQNWDIPILTTNYDNVLEKAINAKYFDFGHKSSTESCPISNCYTTNNSPTINDFAIWHINGMLKYPQSILIGLSHYMRNLQDIRCLILPQNRYNAELFNENNMGFTHIKNTWLELIFSKDLFIIGLQLDSNEIVLRWLLLERAKYYALYNHDRRKAWYIITEKEYNESLGKDIGKKLFFKSVGIEIIVLPNYTDIYAAISL